MQIARSRHPEVPFVGKAKGIRMRAFCFCIAIFVLGSTLAGKEQANLRAAIDRVDMPCDPAGPILYQADCTRNPVQYEDSCVVVPEGPGLGIEVDEDLLEELRYKGTRLKQMRGEA